MVLYVRVMMMYPFMFGNIWMDVNFKSLTTCLVVRSGKVSNATNIEIVNTKTELYTFTQPGSGRVQRIT